MTSMDTLSNKHSESEVIKCIKKDLLQCIEDGLKHYKSLMDDLLSHNQPLKYSQLKSYHLRHLEVVTQAMNASYENIGKDYGIETEMQQLLELANMRLGAVINKYFNEIYPRKQEILMESVGKRVKGFTNQAEMMYDEKAEQLCLKGKHISEVERFHQECANESLSLFDDLLSKNNISNEAFWKYELQLRLQERWEDLKEEFTDQESPSTSLSQSPPPYKKNLLKINSKDKNNAAVSEDKISTVGSQLKEIQVDDRHSPTGQKPVKNHENPESRKFKNSEKSKNPEQGHEISSSESANPILRKVIQPPTPAPKVHKRRSTARTFSEYQTPRNIDVGIYFDEYVFKIGIYVPIPRTARRSSASLNSFTEVFTDSPDIYFADQSIVVGKKVRHFAGSDASRCFNMFKLMTSRPTPSHRFRILHTEYKLCGHQIFAVFLSYVLESVEDKYESKIKQIVLTIPFTPTSAAKERIQESARIAGFQNIRIISTLLSTAVTTLHTSLYYKDAVRKGSSMLPLHLFVFDFHKYSFSMGIVVITPSSVSLKFSYGSDNMIACQASSFKAVHQILYENQSVSRQQYDEVLNIYAKAFSHVVNKAGIDLFHRVVINNPGFKMKHFEHVVSNLINSKLNVDDTSLLGDTLLGASLIASSISNSEAANNLTHILPSHVNICDSSRSNFKLSLGLEKGTFFTGYQQLNEGFVFRQPCRLPFKVDQRNIQCVVRLDEEYCKDQSLYEVCCLQIDYQRRPTDNVFKFVFDLLVDSYWQFNVDCIGGADGVYRLSTDCVSDFNNQFRIMRTDKNRCGSTGYCGTPSEFAKIMSFYTNSTGSFRS